MAANTSPSNTGAWPLTRLRESWREGVQFGSCKAALVTIRATNLYRGDSMVKKLPVLCPLCMGGKK